MNSRVEHFTPPKGYAWGEWVRWLVGPIPAYKSRNGGYPAFYKSYRIGQMESPRICDTRFLSSTGLTASIVERHDSMGFVVAKLGRSTPTPPAFCMNIKAKELRNLHFVSH